MRVDDSTYRNYLIEADGLDPIHVTVIPYMSGKSRIIVQCYTKAWTAYWGAHGNRSLEQFIAMNDKDYMAGNLFIGASDGMTSGLAIVKQREYVERVSKAIIDYFKALGNET